MKFFRNILLFCLPIIAAFIALEVRLRHIPNQFADVRQSLGEKKEERRALLVGTSHSVGIKVENFSQSTAFAAIPLLSLTVMTQLIEKFSTQLPNLKLVLLELAYFGRDYILYGTTAESQLFDLYQVFGIRGDADWDHLLDFRYYSRFFSMGRETAISFLKGYLPPEEPTEIQFGLDAASAANQAGFHQGLLNEKGTDRNLKSMRRLAKFLNQRGISLVVYITPYTEAYRKAIDQARFKEAQQEVLQALAPVQPSFLDFSESTGFDNSDFYNVDHLNVKGHRKFSALLDERIVQPFFNNSISQGG